MVPFSPRLELDLKTGSGSTGIENVRGSRFADRFYGNELDNELFGNGGNDWLYGYDGIDSLSGGSGDDYLYGGNQRDYLYGESGRDQLFGELGDDYLHGGYDGAADVLTGGEGADEFVRFYRWALTTSPNPPFIVQIQQLVEGETLADYNASLGDRIVKEMVFTLI
jgi:Ca2+-binding RTX toxin-like protein